MRRKLAATSAVALVLALIGWIAGGGTLAAFHATTGNTGNTFSASSDFQAPTVSGSVIAATVGDQVLGASAIGGSGTFGSSGWVHQGGTYKIFANASDNVSTGTNLTVTADVSSGNNGVGSSGDTTVTLSYDATGVTVGGVLYHYISDKKTAASSLSSSNANTKTHTVTATDQAANSSSQNFTTTGVDNTAPPNPTGGSFSTVTTPMKGTVTLTATPTADATSPVSGTAGARFQLSPGSVDACFAAGTSGSARSCSFDTTSVADGVYTFQTVTVDNAGNQSAVPASQNNKRIDNTPPSVTNFSVPASSLAGSVTLSADVTDGGSGVNTVRFDYSPAGANTWSTACNGSLGTAPTYSCSFDTKTVTDDSNYDFRVVATDQVANSTTSATITRHVSNPPVAVDVQTNAGDNIPSIGDVVTYTFSKAMNPATIDTVGGGWNGTTKTGLSVRIVDNGTTDQLQVFDGATQVNLGVHDLQGNYVTGGNASFPNSSIQLTTGGTVLLVTLGGTPTGGTLQAGGKHKMLWSASSSAQDLAGNAALTTQITETGANDNDF